MSILTAMPLQTITLTAGGAVEKHRLVGITGAHTGAGARAIGVADVDADSGDLFPVVTQGVALVVAGAAVAAGADLESDATGRVVTLSTGKLAGVALTAAAAAGTKVRVLLE